MVFSMFATKHLSMPAVVSNLGLLSWNYLLTNSEYFICSDSVFDLFASGMFRIVSKTFSSSKSVDGLLC